MTFDIRILEARDAYVLGRVAPGVFDRDIDPDLAAEFLRDPRHHLAVATDGGLVIGFASAVHYVHPDKTPELWINEIGVAPSYQGRGIGKGLLAALFRIARELRCGAAWVLTDHSNEHAVRLYTAVGGRQTDQLMFSFDLSERV